MSDTKTILCLDCPHESQGDPFSGDTTSRITLQNLVDNAGTVQALALAYWRFVEMLSNESTIDPNLMLGNSLFKFNHEWWIRHGRHKLEVVATFAFYDTWLKRKEQRE